MCVAMCAAYTTHTRHVPVPPRVVPVGTAEGGGGRVSEGGVAERGAAEGGVAERGAAEGGTDERGAVDQPSVVPRRVDQSSASVLSSATSLWWVTCQTQGGVSAKQNSSKGQCGPGLGLGMWQGKNRARGRARMRVCGTE